MKLTLRQLQVFLAVARSGSTAAAGPLLALSQSAASAALKELESSLGASLFERTGGRLVLNDCGRSLLPRAQLLIDSAQSIESGFTSLDGSLIYHLRIGASTTIGNYVMPTLLADFRRTHPLGKVDTMIGNTEDVGHAVAALEVDLGLIEGPCHDRQLRVTPWMSDELVVVCSPTHALAKGRGRRKVGVALLRDAEWLLREPGSGTREAVDNALLPHLHHLESSIQLGSAEAIKLAASKGLGLACLSRRVVHDFVAARRLVILDCALPRIIRRFSIIHHAQRVHTPAVGLFARHCAAMAPSL